MKNFTFITCICSNFSDLCHLKGFLNFYLSFLSPCLSRSPRVDKIGSNVYEPAIPKCSICEKLKHTLKEKDRNLIFLERSFQVSEQNFKDLKKENIELEDKISDLKQKNEVSKIGKKFSSLQFRSVFMFLFL